MKTARSALTIALELVEKKPVHCIVFVFRNFSGYLVGCIVSFKKQN